jgi:hypothetical protein
MNAPLAARLPFEVFDDVGDIDFIPVDPGCGKGLIQQSARRAYKGPALAVLAVARLLTDHDHACILRAFAENCLRSIPVQVASLTAGGALPELRQSRSRLSW